MIKLGLARITRLLEHTALPWRAIHVAGTNGKGSVCAYASAMLNAARVKCGRYTSPHLINRWDCIVINEKIVDEKLFHEVEASVMKRNNDNNVDASPFELLTATAFEIFDHEKVDIGIVEVGLGGKEDATNILRDPLVTVITKIGKDHQALLGDSLVEIAFQKAGIMKKGVPCIVDGTNSFDVLGVFEQNAEAMKAGPLIQIPQRVDDLSKLTQNFLCKNNFETHQKINIQLAVEAVRYTLQYVDPSLEISSLLSAIPKTLWPGRLQDLSIKAITGRERLILLDGAHNAQSAEVLGLYVDVKLRQKYSPVTWVMAFSRGKDMRQIIPYLIRPGDRLVANRLGTVDGMPWVQSEDVEDILKIAQELGIGQANTSRDISQALRQATEMSNGGPLVIAGSLYQVSDVLNLLYAGDSAKAFSSFHV